MQISQAPICNTTLEHSDLSVNRVPRPGSPGRGIVYAPEPIVAIVIEKGRKMEVLHSTTFASPVGPLFLAASESGLVALEFEARLPGQQTIRPNPGDLRAE